MSRLSTIARMKKYAPLRTFALAVSALALVLTSLPMASAAPPPPVSDSPTSEVPVGIPDAASAPASLTGDDVVVVVDNAEVARQVAVVVPGTEVVVETDRFVSLSVPEGSVDAARDAAERTGSGFEVDVPMYLTSSRFPVFPVPNDPFWNPWYGAVRGNLRASWGVTTGEPDVVIAVVDTGVAELPDIAGRVLPGWSYFEGQSANEDADGHGTMVAQVAAGAVNNGFGAAGTCPECSILPVQVFDPDGDGTTPSTVVAAGVLWAADNGADIINLSLAGANQSPALSEAVKYADEQGVILVGSAGNQGMFTCPPQNPEWFCGNRVQYPAGYPEVLSVAGGNQDRDLYQWSSNWPGINIVAPGANLVQDPLSTDFPIFMNFSGTSSSAPFVAGLIGLYLTVFPDATREEIWDDFAATALDPGALIDGSWGYVDPGALMPLAAGRVNPAQVIAAPEFVNVGEEMEIEGVDLSFVRNVSFGGVDAQPTERLAEQLSVVVPVGVSQGLVDVVLSGFGGDSEPFTVFVDFPAPEAFSAEPASGATPGDEVTVSGNWFVPGETRVTIGGVEAEVTEVTLTTVAFIVPPDKPAGSYDVVVTTPADNVTLAGVVVIPPRPPAPVIVRVYQQIDDVVVDVKAGTTSGGETETIVVTDSVSGGTCEVAGTEGSCVITTMPRGSIGSLTAVASNSSGLSPASALRGFVVRTGSPVAELSTVTQSGPGKIRLTGWALDTDTLDDIVVEVLVEENLVGSTVANKANAAAFTQFPGYGANRGFDIEVTTGPGRFYLCINVKNVGFGGDTRSCQNMLVKAMPPPSTRCPVADLAAIPSWARIEACWAVNQGVTTANPFRPSDVVTRAQMARFLWNSAGAPPFSERCGMADEAAIPTWGRESACWALLFGVTSANPFRPADPVSRAQMVTFLWNMAGNPPAAQSCGFTDQASIPSWATEAACWAKSDGITVVERFRPADPVSRAQMVTFLYRLYEFG